ncbi:MAG: hypothetical protein E3K40_15510 [Candidatus Brocadia sp.]|nr:hypothetical protein [Candidatus Brocadia sp.]
MRGVSPGVWVIFSAKSNIFMEAFFLALLTAFIWGFVPFLEKIGLSSVEPTTAYLVRCSGVLLGVVILLAFTPQFPSFVKWSKSSCRFSGVQKR